MGHTIQNVPLGLTNTVVLITSSVTMVMAWAALKMNNFKQHKVYLVLTILCALTFLVVKYFEYSAKFAHHNFPKTSTYLGMYFTLSGLHGIHVIGGLIVLFYNLGPGVHMWKAQPERFTNRIEILGLYWHFVDLVWIFLFPIFYLL